MSFNEKSRWVAIVATIAVWGWYFSQAAAAIARGAEPDGQFLGRMIGVIVLLVVLQVAAMIVLAILSPAEAGSGMDERERAIERHAAARAYTLLSFGIVVVVGASFLGMDKFALVHAVLFAFILAEVLRYATELAAYRRGFV